jgi:hypothetical protein
MEIASSDAVTQKTVTKHAEIISAFIAAAIAALLYIVLVGPIEPVVWFFWVAPVAGGVGFLVSSGRDRAAKKQAELDYIQPRQNHTEDERAAFVASIKTATTPSKPSFADTPYESMGPLLRFTFRLWIGFGWIIRTLILLGIPYAVSVRVLPENFSDIPFSNWTLRILGSFMFSAWISFIGVYWFFHSPELKSSHTFSENHYSGWLSFAWSLAVIMVLVWFFFFDGFAVLTGR